VRLFRYEASTIDGHDLFGAIEALNARDAVTRLSQRGMRSIFIVAIDADSQQNSGAQRESLRLRARRPPAGEEAVVTDDDVLIEDNVDGGIGALDKPAAESVECHRAIRGEQVTDSIAWTTDRSIDKSVDASVDLDTNVYESDPLDRTQLREVCHATPTGERVLALIDRLTSHKVPFYCALSALTSSRLPRSTGRLLGELSEAMESAASVEDLLQWQRSAFGSVALEFLRIGEQQTGITRSLSAYLAFRREQRIAGAFRPGSLLSARTRRFAITFACAQEISGDVVGSLRCAAMEMPRRLRRRLAESVLWVQSGDDLGKVLPKSTFFKPGFEPHFVEMVDEGLHLSQLPATLRLLAYS
jgi:type II secretory pathway component PulF